VLSALNPYRKRKRRYRLSAEGKAVLAAAILKTKPWERSTGPRSVIGKLVVGQNPIKHGYYNKMPLEDVAEFKAFMKKLRRKSDGRGRHPHAGLPVWVREGAGG
jgi:hypothetical protein